MDKEAVLLIADSHINSKVGLMPPGIIDAEGTLFERNKIQKWLWRTWTQHLDEVEKLISGYKLTVILNGDILELDDKQRSWQLHDRNPSTVLDMARNVFVPLLTSFDAKLIVIRGTEAHTGKNAWIEDELAKDLGAIPDKDSGSASWWHFRGSFSGVLFDIAHHSNMGNLYHTFPNTGNRIAVETMLEYSEWKWNEKLPNYVVRSHNHRFADSGRTYPVRVISTPCWQFKTAFLHRIGKPNAMPDIGSLLFLLDNGQSTFYDMRYKPKRSSPWRPENQNQK